MKINKLIVMAVISLLAAPIASLGAGNELENSRARSKEARQSQIMSLPSQFGLLVGISTVSDFKLVVKKENWIVGNILKENILGTRLFTGDPPKDGSIPIEFYKEDPSVSVISVKGLAIEGIYEARYSFHDDVLYEIDYWFIDPETHNKINPPERTINFRELLVGKYGEPNDESNIQSPYKEQSNIFTSYWDINKNTQKELSIKLVYYGLPTRPQLISYRFMPIWTILWSEHMKIQNRLYNNKGTGADGL